MKSTFTDNGNQELKEDYPCLKRLNGSSLIVLFVAKNEGIVMMDNDKGARLPIGSYESQFNEDNFVSLPKGYIVQFVN